MSPKQLQFAVHSSTEPVTRVATIIPQPCDTDILALLWAIRDAGYSLRAEWEKSEE